MTSFLACKAVGWRGAVVEMGKTRWYWLDANSNGWFQVPTMSAAYKGLTCRLSQHLVDTGTATNNFRRRVTCSLAS
jgi:hypothetical protein